MSPDGAQAELATDAVDGSVIRVRNGQGCLLFEYQPERRRAVVYAPDGDLEFAAPRGSVSIDGRDGVSVRAGRALDLVAGHTVRLSTDTSQPAELTLGSRGLQATAAAIGVRAARADVDIDDANVLTRILHTAAEKAHTLIGTIDVRATRIVERAQDVLRAATGLSQTTARRLKLTAEEAFEARGRQALIEADEDVKVQGETIRLG